MLYFLDNKYNYDINKIELIFYDDSDETIFVFNDNTGYMPYLLTDYMPDLYKIKCMKDEHTYFPFESIEKYNPYIQKNQKYLKIFTENIYQLNGGRKYNNKTDYKQPVSLADFLDENDDEGIRSFENKVKNTFSYIADNNLVYGMPYTIKKIMKKVYSIKKCIKEDKNNKKCNSKYSIERWGYNIKDENGKLELLKTICNDCRSLIYNNDKILEENREYVYELNRMNDVVIENKEIFYPVLENFEIDKKIVDEINELFKNEQSEKPLLNEWNQYFFSKIPNIKRVAFDIEVLPKNKQMPKPENPHQPIISVSFVDNKGISVVFILKQYKEEGIRIDGINPNVSIYEYDDEKELLKQSFEYMKKYPMLISFNGDNFDLNYMYHRALLLKGFVDLKIGRKKKNKIKKIVNDDNNEEKEELYEIPFTFEMRKKKEFGGNLVDLPVFMFDDAIHIDVMNFFKKPPIKLYAFKGAYEFNSLNEISKKLLKKRKVADDIVDESGKKKMINDYTKWELIYYNLIDSELTIELTTFDNNLVMNLIFFIMRISKTPISELINNEISHWIKNMLYFYHKKFNYLIPRRETLQHHNYSCTSSLTKGKGFKGAFVKEPIQGIHFDVSLMDFASLYPSIIKMYNLSYETINVCEHDECKKNIVPDTTHYVCKKVTGIISLLVGIIRDYRVFYFKKKSTDKSIDSVALSFFKTIEQALKVFINGSYGVVGSREFALFCIPVPESTTAIGRFAINGVIDECEKKLNKKVITGDTDSMFIHHATDDDIAYIINYAQQTYGLEIAFETRFRFISVSQRKKAYIAFSLDKNEKVMVKSLAGKKKNTPIFLRDEFKETVDYINQNINLESDKKKIKPIFRERIIKLIDAINKNLIPYEKLVYHQTIGKDPYKGYKTTIPQHIRAVRMLKDNQLNKYDENIDDSGKKNDDEDDNEDEISDLHSGDFVEYLKIKDGEGVIPIGNVEKGQTVSLDKEKYKENIKSVFIQLLECFEIDYDELISMKKEVKLDFFQ